MSLLFVRTTSKPLIAEADIGPHTARALGLSPQVKQKLSHNAPASEKSTEQKGNGLAESQQSERRKRTLLASNLPWDLRSNPASVFIPTLRGSKSPVFDSQKYNKYISFIFNVPVAPCYGSMTSSF